jgi:hypothetical protein
MSRNKGCYFNPREEEEEEPEELDLYEQMVCDMKCIHCQHGMHHLCEGIVVDPEKGAVPCACPCAVVEDDG